MKNELNNKPGFILGFISAIVGAIGLLCRDNKKLDKGSRIGIITGSAILSIVGLFSMLVSLDKSLIPVPEKDEEDVDRDEDDDDVFEDDLD